MDESLRFFRESALKALQSHDREVRESLGRRQIPLQKVPTLDNSFHIDVKLDAGIQARSVRPAIARQIEAVAAFLRDFQIGVLGQRTTLFQLYEVEILIEKKTRFSLVYNAGKLIIYLPHWQVRWLDKYYTYPQLREAWDTGEHLSPRSPLKTVWWLFNPLGEFRSSLKATLMLAVQKQVLGLDQLLFRFGLLDVPEADKKAENAIPKNFKQGVIRYLKTVVNEQTLGVDLEMILHQKGDRDLLKLLKQYQDTLTDPTHLEEIIDVASLSLREALREEQAKVDVKMLGFVNVGNYHRIDVDLKITVGYWRKYVEVIPRKTEIRAIQVGFVNVYTVDDITVTPTFQQGVKIDFETAALEKTLQDTGVLDAEISAG